MSTLSLPDATLFGWNIWSFGFHYDGQTGEAFVCQTQELLSVQFFVHLLLLHVVKANAQRIALVLQLV